MKTKFFQVGKTYIENDPYKAPELLTVAKIVWVGEQPGVDVNVVAFGWGTESYPGVEWKAYLSVISKAEMEEEDFSKTWVEAVWDDDTKYPHWRAKTPEELQ